MLSGSAVAAACSDTLLENSKCDVLSVPSSSEARRFRVWGLGTVVGSGKSCFNRHPGWSLAALPMKILLSLLCILSQLKTTVSVLVLSCRLYSIGPGD